MKGERFTEHLSSFLFWDVNPSDVDMDTHRQFIIPRVMERGTFADVMAIWNYYGTADIKSALLNAADLSIKTISFFSNQFNIPREAFRAFRKPAANWTP